MNKLREVADRIKATQHRLDAEADLLAARLDKIDLDAPKAFERGHAFLDEQKKDVAAIEDTLRQMTNLPLEGTASEKKP